MGDIYHIYKVIRIKFCYVKHFNMKFMYPTYDLYTLTRSGVSVLDNKIYLNHLFVIIMVLLS